MNTVRSFIKGFFIEGSKESMARLLAFVCGFSAAIVSIFAVYLGLNSALTYDYVALTAILWAAAFGGKNWSKSVELKKKENGSTTEG